MVIDNGHTGITELLPVMLDNNSKLWVIIHTSKRLSQEMMENEELKLKEMGLNVRVIG